VIANILARPLIELAPVLVQALRPGGKLALCGILAAQAQSVSERYAPWLALEAEATEEGWVLLASRGPTASRGPKP
jgi:ribosomal protein L11 methyltransferase